MLSSQASCSHRHAPQHIQYSRPLSDGIVRPLVACHPHAPHIPHNPHEPFSHARPCPRRVQSRHRCGESRHHRCGRSHTPADFVRWFLNCHVCCDHALRPNYEMASELPLLLYDIGYEDVRWVSSPSSLADLASHWEERQIPHRLRSAMCAACAPACMHASACVSMHACVCVRLRASACVCVRLCVYACMRAFGDLPSSSLLWIRRQDPPHASLPQVSLHASLTSFGTPLSHQVPLHASFASLHTRAKPDGQRGGN